MVFAFFWCKKGKIDASFIADGVVSLGISTSKLSVIPTPYDRQHRRAALTTGRIIVMTNFSKSFYAELERLAPLPQDVHCQTLLAEVVYFGPLGKSRRFLGFLVRTLRHGLHQAQRLCISHVVLIPRQALFEVVVASFSMAGIFRAMWRFLHRRRHVEVGDEIGRASCRERV